MSELELILLTAIMSAIIALAINDIYRWIIVKGIRWFIWNPSSKYLFNKLYLQEYTKLERNIINEGVDVFVAVNISNYILVGGCPLDFIASELVERDNQDTMIKVKFKPDTIRQQIHDTLANKILEGINISDKNYQLKGSMILRATKIIKVLEENLIDNNTNYGDEIRVSDNGALFYLLDRIDQINNIDNGLWRITWLAIKVFFRDVVTTKKILLLIALLLGLIIPALIVFYNWLN